MAKALVPEQIILGKGKDFLKNIRWLPMPRPLEWVKLDDQR